MRCTNCQLTILREANYCPRCGSLLSGGNHQRPDPDASEAATAASQLLEAKRDFERAQRRLTQAEEDDAARQRPGASPCGDGFGLMMFFWTTVLILLLLAWFGSA